MDHGQTFMPSMPLIWLCVPPSGEEIRVLNADGSPQTLNGMAKPMFIACGAEVHGGKRLFVFLPPLSPAFFSDDQVSWFFQRRMIDLSPAQQALEMEFRSKRAQTQPSGKESK
jgi:hypothetical protein